jgi:hypothetical protein
MAADNLRLGIEIEADGAEQTARAVGAVQDQLEGVNFDGSSFKSAQETIGATTRQLQELAETFQIDGAAPMNLPVVSRLLAELRANAATTADDLESLRQASGLTAEEFDALNAALGRIEKRNTDSLARLSSALGTNLGGAKEFADALGLTADEASEAFSRMKQLSGAGATQEEVFTALSRELDITADQYSQLSAAANRARDASAGVGDDLANAGEEAGGGFGEALGSITGVANGINEIVGAGQLLLSSLGPAYEFLIGSNEKLNQQLLASQANIAATADISLNGKEVTDPTEKILASQGALQQALKDLEIKTQDLVGVTDADVQGVFQVLLQNTAALTGQSKEFGNAIEASTELSAGLVATLGTLGVPIDQASSEVGDLIKGQITSDSIVAKSLGINNQMVQGWKSQGVLVDELNKRFETFKAGNALAANSIAGVTSNIQSLFEDIGRQVGADLLQPLVDGLKQVIDFLNTNKAAFLEFGTEVSSRFQAVAGNLMAALGDTVGMLTGNVEGLLDFALDRVDNFLKVAEVVGVALIDIGEVLLPLIVGQLKAGQEVGPVLVKTFQGLGAVIGRIAELVGPIAQAIGATVAAAGRGVAVLYGGAEEVLGRMPNLLAGSLKSPIQESEEAVESYSNVLQTLMNEAAQRNGDLQDAIEARADAEENGTKLTEEQLEAEKAALATTELTLDALRAQRKELEEAAITGGANREAIEGQKAALDAQIEGLEESTELLGENSEALEINAKAATDLGTATEQFAQKSAGALDKLNSGTGTTEELEEAASTLMEVGEQQVALGEITAEEYAKNLESIASNTTLSAEQQLEAEEKLTELKEKELEKRLQAFENAQSEIEADLEAGRVNEIEGEKAVTKSKLGAIAEETAARKEALARLEGLGRGDGDEANEIRQNLKELAADAEKIALESAQKISELRLQELEEEQDKARQILEQAQIDQQNALKRLQLEGLAGESEVKQQQLDQESDRLQEELKLARENSKERLKERRNLLKEELKLASSPKEEAEIRKKFNEETEQAKRDAALETAQIEGDLLDNQIAKEEAAREKIREAIDLQVQVATMGVEKQVAAGEELERSLARQTELIQSQNDLFVAQNALAQNIGQNRIDGFNRALQSRKEIDALDQKSIGLIDDIRVKQEGIEKTEREGIKNLQEGILRAERDQANVASGRERFLESLIAKEEEGSKKRIDLEKDLEAEQRKRAKATLAAERELAAVTGKRSGVIQAQLALAKEGSQEQASLEKALLQELSKEEVAAKQEEIEAAKEEMAAKQKEIEEAKEAQLEAKKQGEIAAAEERQRREELAGLGLDANASEIDIIKAKQAAEDELARKKFEALQNEQKQQQIALELDIQRNKLASERNLLQARAAALAAQQNLAEAELALAQDPNNELLKAQIDLAKQGVELANQGAANAEQDLANQEESAANQRELLALQQQAALEQAQQDERFRQMDQARELAGQGLMNATALATAGDIQSSDFERVGIAGQVQQVGSSLSGAAIPDLNIPPLEVPPLVIPPVEIDPDNPMNQNLEGLRQDFQTLAAIMANATGNTTINVGNNAAAANADVGRLMIAGGGL